MTNRDRLQKMSPEELLLKLNKLKCTVASIDNLETFETLKRCRKFGSCEKCIQAWLNEKCIQECLNEMK